MKSILKLFSEHSTFIQPDALKYISSKENPNEFASFLIKNLMEYPLILTFENIKHIEESAKINADRAKIMSNVKSKRVIWVSD